MGERFNGIEEVVGSIPSGSTIKNPCDANDLERLAINQIPPAKSSGKRLVSSSERKPNIPPERAYPALCELKLALRRASDLIAEDEDNRLWATSNLIAEITRFVIETGFWEPGTHQDSRNWDIEPLLRLRSALDDIRRGASPSFLTPANRHAPGRRTDPTDAWLGRHFLCLAVEAERRAKPSLDEARQHVAKAFIKLVYRRHNRHKAAALSLSLESWRKLFEKKSETIHQGIVEGYHLEKDYICAQAQHAAAIGNHNFLCALESARTNPRFFFSETS